MERQGARKRNSSLPAVSGGKILRKKAAGRKTMTELMLDFMLGPMRAIGEFYFEYQMIFNPIIVGAALIKILFGKKKVKNESANSES